MTMTVRKVHYRDNDRTKAARCDDITEEMNVSVVFHKRTDPPAMLLKTASHRIMLHDDPTESNYNTKEKSFRWDSVHHSPPSSRRVTFGSVETIPVPSSKNDASLWWSKMDMISIRRADRISCYNDPEIKNYLYHFETFYRTLDSDAAEEPRLECQTLATGLREGYQGIERESPFEEFRQEERKQIVSSVVAAYKSLEEDTGIDDDEVLRSVSLNLTRKMALFAICMAQAAHLATYDKLEP